MKGIKASSKRNFSKREELKRACKRSSVTTMSTPLQRVREVFPDIHGAYAEMLLDKNNAAEVIEYISAKWEPYPKKTDKVGGSDTVSLTGDGETTCDFLDPNSFDPMPRYKSESINKLAAEFPFLSRTVATRHFESSSCHYAIAHQTIVQSVISKWESNDEPQAQKEIKLLEALLLDRSAMSLDQTNLLVTSFEMNIKPRLLRQRSPQISDPILRKEIDFVRSKLRNRIDELQRNISEQKASEQAIRKQSVMECGCCYDHVPLEDMIPCQEEGHLFCKECIAAYVETQVFANGNFGINSETKEPNLDLVCCHGDGCISGFDRSFLQKALNPKVLQKYDEMQYWAAIETAGLLRDMCTCPKCGIAATLEDGQEIFICPQESCAYESCRHCKEASHSPYPCEDKATQSVRTKIEEAAAAAVIRKCPSCSRGVIKADGCNKMTCSCRVHFCYLCQKLVKVSYCQPLRSIVLSFLHTAHKLLPILS